LAGGDAVASAREHVGATAVMVVSFFRFGDDRGREKEGVKGEASWGWRGGLEGHRGLTNRAVVSIWMPRRAHAAALAYGRSATELSLFPFRDRRNRLTAKLWPPITPNPGRSSMSYS
jgi:hypothetical protein